MHLDYDLKSILKISNALKAAGNKMDLVMVRASNHTGPIARTAMIRSMVAQTGMRRRVMVKALRQKLAFNGANYEIKARGGNVRLMFFRARETRKGVTAAPWNKRSLHPSMFLKGGLFPGRKKGGNVAAGSKAGSNGRVALKMGGAVLHRVGKRRLPLKGALSGLYIPDEMTKGNTEAAFYKVVASRMPGRIAHELYRVLG